MARQISRDDPEGRLILGNAALEYRFRNDAAYRGSLLSRLGREVFVKLPGSARAR
jgi:hypothetical protein